MAKKILGGIGGLLGIGKKKKAETAPAAEQKGPIVTPLGTAGPTMRRRIGAAQMGRALLSDRLGGIGKLGG